MNDVVEINSGKHSIHQCMDIVLGSIAFMLNRKNETFVDGIIQKGNRTIAKEKLFCHILQRIQESDEIEFFDIGETTPIVIPKDYWTMPYRHWKFVSAEFRKKDKKEKSPA